MLKNKHYDKLKWLSQIVFPAIITLYSVIAYTCSIPHTAEIITIAIACNTCLGSILGISTKNYKKAVKKNEEDT